MSALDFVIDFGAMNRRAAIPAFAAVAEWHIATATGRRNVRFVSGVDRWRPGAVIPVYNCAGPEWDQGARIAITNWASGFALATMQADGCLADGNAGVVIQARDEAPARDGSTWHGKLAATNHDRDGYLCYAAVEVNTYWYEDFPADDPARAALLCHELGHALGAGHAPCGTGGCMAQVCPGEPPPTEHDPTPGPWTIADLIAAYTAPLVPIGKRPKRKRRRSTSQQRHSRSARRTALAGQGLITDGSSA